MNRRRTDILDELDPDDMLVSDLFSECQDIETGTAASGVRRITDSETGEILIGSIGGVPPLD